MQRRSRWFTTASLGSLGLVLVACGTDPPNPGGPTSGTFPASDAEGPCAAVAQEHAIEGFNHIPECSPTDYKTNPPSSGDHYPIWAAFKTYESRVPLGYLVHDLEHGAIVFTYNCAVGSGTHTGQAECDSEVAAAQAMIDALPPDPVCVMMEATNDGVRVKAVLVPDPDLDVRFAASAWGWTLRANCFDADAFRAFAITHYDMGREAFCTDGEDVVSTGIPASCGEE